MAEKLIVVMLVLCLIGGIMLPEVEGGNCVCRVWGCRRHECRRGRCSWAFPHLCCRRGWKCPG